MVCWNEKETWDQSGGPYISVGVGQRHYCAVETGGRAVCWGSNDEGQTDAPDGPFVSVSAGIYTTCGIRPGGALVCWGAYAR